MTDTPEGFVTGLAEALSRQDTTIDLDDLSDEAVTAIMNALNPGIHAFKDAADREAFSRASLEVTTRHQTERRLVRLCSVIEPVLDAHRVHLARYLALDLAKALNKNFECRPRGGGVD